MGNRKGYATVYWGKMPVNFRLQDFAKHEVEAAVGYAERSFRDVSDLVPDFSVLTLGAGPRGHRGRARAGRREGGEGPPARRTRRLQPR
jgi:hypothetical protein